MAEPATLAQLGEAELIRRLEAYAPPGQFNDDAALLQERSGRVLVVTTDVLVEGIHFSDATVAAADIAVDAAARALLTSPLLAHVAGETAAGAVAARRMLRLARVAAEACRIIPAGAAG